MVDAINRVDPNFSFQRRQKRPDSRREKSKDEFESELEKLAPETTPRPEEERPRLIDVVG